MKQVTISDLLAAASLVLNLKSNRNLDVLADRQPQSSLTSLVEMMSPANVIPALRDLKVYLLSLPTLYPNATTPYTPTQVEVLRGLLTAVNTLTPSSFSVLGIPMTGLFASSMEHADEVVSLTSEVRALITLELARGAQQPGVAPT